MALEIERRFLVHGDDWRQAIGWQARLQQGYLVSGAEGVTLRVRTASQAAGEPQAWLTVKTPGSADGLVRQEFEYAIPQADAEDLLELAPHRLSKWRYGLGWPGGDWVLDVFEGANGPLVVAEVELDDPQQPLEIPACCVLELTGHTSLSNAALAQQPLQSWPEPQRLALLRGAPDWMVA